MNLTVVNNRILIAWRTCLESDDGSNMDWSTEELEREIEGVFDGAS